MNTQNSRKPLQVVGLAANPIVGQIWEIAEPLCASEGLELVHVEFQREQAGRTLRVYLDKPGGITLDDCAGVSRQLSDLLDVGLETQTPYRLEVSSPGINRPLGKLDDFKRFCGQRVKIRIRQAIDGRKNFTGVLENVGDNQIHVRVNDNQVAIEFTDIAKAQLG